MQRQDVTVWATCILWWSMSAWSLEQRFKKIYGLFWLNLLLFHPLHYSSHHPLIPPFITLHCYCFKLSSVFLGLLAWTTQWLRNGAPTLSPTSWVWAPPLQTVSPLVIFIPKHPIQFPSMSEDKTELIHFSASICSATLFPVILRHSGDSGHLTARRS